MPEIDGKVLSQSPKKTVLTVLLQNLKKISCNAFCRKTYAALFYGILYHIFSKVVKLLSSQEMHCFYKCLKYNKLSLPKRFTFVKSKKMCFKRLRKDVLTSNYKLKLTCF